MLFDNIEPCPKCGSTHIWFKRGESLDGNYGNFEFYCEDCKYSTVLDPEFPENREETIRRWNQFALKSIAKHELAPCPFCGSTKVYIQHENESIDKYNRTVPERYSVYCDNCGANTRKQYDLNSALNFWNIRYKF